MVKSYKNSENMNQWLVILNIIVPNSTANYTIYERLKWNCEGATLPNA